MDFYPHEHSRGEAKIPLYRIIHAPGDYPLQRAVAELVRVLNRTAIGAENSHEFCYITVDNPGYAAGASGGISTASTARCRAQK